MTTSLSPVARLRMLLVTVAIACGLAIGSPTVAVAAGDSPVVDLTSSAGDALIALQWSVSSSSTDEIEVVVVPGGTRSLPGTATSTVIDSLSNGQSYDVMVRARDASGWGPYEVHRLRPMDASGAPSDVEATIDSGSATVTWSPPTNPGGVQLDYYEVRASTGATTIAGADFPMAVFNGLASGTVHSFQVRAVYQNAAGPYARSNDVSYGPSPTAPSRPTATPTDSQVLVEWAAASGNGTPITSYTVTAFPGGASRTVSGSLTSAVFTGLSNGTAYTFTAWATSTNGTSLPSEQSLPVTAAAVPDAPAKPAGQAGDQKATVSWAAPAANGSAVTGYVVRVSPGGQELAVDGALTSVDVEGLSNGTAYTFTVAATNAMGTSAASQASALVTPVAPTPATTPPTPPTTPPTPDPSTTSATTTTTTTPPAASTALPGSVATTTKGSAPNSVKAGSKAAIKAVVKAGNHEPIGKITITVKGKGFSFSKTVKYTGGKVTVNTSKLKRAGKYKVTIKFEAAAGSVFKNSKDTDSITVEGQGTYGDDDGDDGDDDSE